VLNFVGAALAWVSHQVWEGGDLRAAENPFPCHSEPFAVILSEAKDLALVCFQGGARFLDTFGSSK
jgi:hypothetical protein